MKALRYENKKLAIADLPRPSVNGEVIVRVTLSGICNTDLEISRGYAGFQGTIGHEFVGIVESLAEAPPSGRARTREVRGQRSEVGGQEWRLASRFHCTQPDQGTSSNVAPKVSAE